MRSSIFPADPKTPLVGDASTVINLIATGCAPSIIAALPYRMLVVDLIPGELDSGRSRGRKDADRLTELVAAGLIDIVSLGDMGWQSFEGLVSGPAADTLDDGEAATIAYAMECLGTAVLDERKAMRICGTRFPALSLISTTDILLHPNVRGTLGEEELSNAVFRALTDARMRVLAQNLEEIVQLIGPQRASVCLSLPKTCRGLGEKR